MCLADYLQITIDDIFNWTGRWKIQINSGKSAHVSFTLRETLSIQVLLDHKIIPQKQSS